MHRSHASNFGRHLGHWSEVLLVQLSLNSKSSNGVSKILWRWWAQVIRPVAEQHLSVRFEKVNQDTTTTIWRFMITKCQYIITHAILPSLLYKWKKVCKQINLQTAYSSTFGFQGIEPSLQRHQKDASAHLDVIWLVQVCLFPGFNQSRSYLKLYYWKKRLGLK